MRTQQKIKTHTHTNFIAVDSNTLIEQSTKRWKLLKALSHTYTCYVFAASEYEGRERERERRRKREKENVLSSCITDHSLQSTWKTMSECVLRAMIHTYTATALARRAMRLCVSLCMCVCVNTQHTYVCTCVSDIFIYIYIWYVFAFIPFDSLVRCASENK